jgi:hypothetical protein
MNHSRRAPAAATLSVVRLKKLLEACDSPAANCNYRAGWSGVSRAAPCGGNRRGAAWPRRPQAARRAAGRRRLDGLLDMTVDTSQAAAINRLLVGAGIAVSELYARASAPRPGSCLARDRAAAETIPV